MLRLFNTRCLILSFIPILNSTKFASILVINAPFANQIQKHFITFCIVVLTGKLSGMNLHHVGFPLQRRESVLIKRYNCRYFNKIMPLTLYSTKKQTNKKTNKNKEKKKFYEKNGRQFKYERRMGERGEGLGIKGIC